MGIFARRPALQLAAEYPPANEQAHIDSLIRRLRAKMERDYAKGRVLRDAHPKMHGCVRAEFSIAADLPPELRVGVFEEGRRYPAWVRFSNQSGTASADYKPDIRGVAIKLMGVEGAKLTKDGDAEKNQDFILISDRRFVTKDVEQFDGLVRGLVGGPLAVGWFFLTHPRVARNLLTSLRRFGNPLGIRYFSVAPYLLGTRAVKYSLTPRGARETPIPARPSDDYLREAMVRQLESGSAVFEFGVQLQTDPQAMPIEDPGVSWDEVQSPFRNVATLTIPAQVFDTARRREFGDNLSFNPWRALPEHRPLGGISRARRQVYEALSAFRHERNQAPSAEPTATDEEWTG